MAEYLYCIIHRSKLNGFPEDGIEGSKPYTLPYQDLCAIVSEAPLKDYEPTDENMKKHNDVELYILKEHTVLPVAFGMVFKSKGILINTMRNVYPILKRSLRLIDNKIELGVKVIAQKEGKAVEEDVPLDTSIPQEMAEDVVEESEEEGTEEESEEEGTEEESEEEGTEEESEDVEEDVPLVVGEETYRIHSADEFRIPETLICRSESHGRDSGNLSPYLISPALAGGNSDTSIPQEMTKDVKEEDFTALDKIAVEVRKGELFSDRLLYNKSFLVDRKDIERFSEEVERIMQKYKGCKIKYSGPWPPYNFVDIRIMGRRR